MSFITPYPRIRLPKLKTPIKQWRAVNPSTVVHTCGTEHIRNVIEAARHDLLELERQREMLWHALHDVFYKVELPPEMAKTVCDVLNETAHANNNVAITSKENNGNQKN